MYENVIYHGFYLYTFIPTIITTELLLNLQKAKLIRADLPRSVFKGSCKVFN